MIEKTIKEAKDFIINHREDGVECPCCGQFCKLYKRALNSSMARFLIWIVRTVDTETWVDWRDAPASVVHGGDYGKLKHWDLIENMVNHNPTQRTSGMWKPTPKGVSFVQRRIRIPKQVFIYDNTVIGFSKENVDIVSALGKKFNYQELMRS
jgi:hypothetical protein